MENEKLFDIICRDPVLRDQYAGHYVGLLHGRVAIYETEEWFHRKGNARVVGYTYVFPLEDRMKQLKVALDSTEDYLIKRVPTHDEWALMTTAEQRAVIYKAA
jgi:hypothetical protein